MAAQKTRPSPVPYPGRFDGFPSPQIKEKKNKSKSQSKEKKEGGADRGSWILAFFFLGGNAAW